MNKYDKMLELNKKKSEEKVTSAVNTIREMELLKQQVRKLKYENENLKKENEKLKKALARKELNLIKQL